MLADAEATSSNARGKDSAKSFRDRIDFVSAPASPISTRTAITVLILQILLTAKSLMAWCLVSDWKVIKVCIRNGFHTLRKTAVRAHC